MNSRFASAAMLLAVLVVGPARAEDPMQGLPAIPQPATVVEAAASDDLEVALEWATFIEAGYRRPTWLHHGAETNDIRERVVSPDYELRTGSKAPTDASFQYATVSLTGGDFNDLLVMSRLPGDCGPNGCRTQLYRTRDGHRWEKVADFVAMGVALKAADGAADPRIAAVGDEVSPSFVLVWDGESFME
jgi:hypothetical protein